MAATWCAAWLVFPPWTLAQRLQRGWGHGDMGTWLLPSARRIPPPMGKAAPRARGNPGTQSHPKNIVLTYKSRFQRTISPFFPMLSAVSHKINSITGFFFPCSSSFTGLVSKRCFSPSWASLAAWILEALVPASAELGLCSMLGVVGMTGSSPGFPLAIPKPEQSYWRKVFVGVRCTLVPSGSPSPRRTSF